MSRKSSPYLCFLVWPKITLPEVVKTETSVPGVSTLVVPAGLALGFILANSKKTANPHTSTEKTSRPQTLNKQGHDI